MLETIKEFMKGQRSFEVQLGDRSTFLSIGVICIRREARGIGCCISWIGCFIHIIRSLRRIISLRVIRVMKVVRWFFCRLRFAFIRLSSGSRLIFGGWGWRLGSVSQQMRKDRTEECMQSLYRRFDLRWISLFLKRDFIFSDDLLLFFY